MIYTVKPKILNACGNGKSQRAFTPCASAHLWFAWVGENWPLVALSRNIFIGTVHLLSSNFALSSNKI